MFLKLNIGLIYDFERGTYFIAYTALFATKLALGPYYK